jgi:hypothetical protein
MGTGNLSEAEIDALEYVVEEGRIACMDDYGILRSLLVRVRPEWENQSYEESDEKHANTNMNRDTTPGEGSVQGEGTVGMADIAHGAAENLQGVCKTFDQWSRETAGVMHRLARHIELLESRVPSDAEREAIALAYSRLTADAKYEEVAATLKAFLERANHDAVPEAKARTDADRDRTDKAVTRPGEGTGDTPSEAEINALEFVVETGHVGTHDAATLRSLLARLA